MSLHILSFPADSNQIPVVYDFLDRFLTQQTTDKALADRIRLAVIEATTNAIIHGSQANPANTIELQINWEDHNGCCRFSVKDQGNGFVVDNLPDPTTPERLEMDSGRGVYIMKQLADRIEFLQGGSEVVLTFKI